MTTQNESLQQDVLITAGDYGRKLIVGIERCCQYLEHEQYGEALDMVPNIGEGLSWISQAAVLTCSKNASELNVEMINSTFQDINDAIENSDFVMLRDIFMYEILGRLKAWHSANYGG